MIPYALNSITGISVEPLRKIAYLQMVPLLSLVISVVGLIISGHEWKQIWTGVLFASIFTETVFLAILVMAEYIAQIMLEVKGRPISIIYEYEPSNSAKERIK